MPKNFKKAKRTKYYKEPRRPGDLETRTGYSKDVTINDYANASEIKVTDRIKKSHVSLKTVVKIEVEPKEHWDSDDEELEPLSDETSNSDKKEQKNKQDYQDDEDDRIDYPIDIWFLISEHIRPEDVGIFAAICKKSYNVVQSVKFWKTLYNRYIKEYATKDFQPECVLRHYGLRTAIIKALFHTYPPFIARTPLAVIGKKDPDILVGMNCIGLTSKCDKSSNKPILLHYFKFKRQCVKSFKNSKTREESLIDLLNDINANPDEDNCMLVAVSSSPICLKPILGKTLKKVSLKLSKGCCNNRLEMEFGNAVDIFCRGNIPNYETIVLDPVISVSIINWWHPMYIKSNAVPFLDEFM